MMYVYLHIYVDVIAEEAEEEEKTQPKVIYGCVMVVLCCEWW